MLMANHGQDHEEVSIRFELSISSHIRASMGYTHLTDKTRPFINSSESVGFRLLTISSVQECVVSAQNMVSDVFLKLLSYSPT